MGAEDLHELILEQVDVLELVDHDVFQPLLPLQADLCIFLKDVEGEFDEVVVVQAEALFFLVEIAVENDILHRRGRPVFLVEGLQGHIDQVQIVVRLFEELLDLDHVPGPGKGHVPEGQPPLLVDELEHIVDVRVVQNQEAPGILDRVAVLLEDGDAEAVEGVDIPRVVVAGEGVDALAHLVGRLVGEGHAENAAGEDAQVVDQVGEPVGEGPGLPGARPRDDPDEPLGGGDRLPLGGVE